MLFAGQVHADVIWRGDFETGDTKQWGGDPKLGSFQVVQESPEAILVRVVPSDGFSKEIAGRIVSALREKGADLEIEVEAVEEIPAAASGKRRFVINRV
jgi:hypothetical protein